jgi:hypothetical protein
MITEKNHKLLTSQFFLTDCTKKGLASMQSYENISLIFDVLLDKNHLTVAGKITSLLDAPDVAL